MSVAKILHEGRDIPSLAHIPDHRWAGHAVQLYTNDKFLIDAMCRFIGGALAAGDIAVLAATRVHLREMEKQLAANGIDTARAAAQGRYMVLDAQATVSKFMIGGMLDEIRFRETIGAVLKQAKDEAQGKDCRTAVFGELVALLWAQGKSREAIRVEQLWNELAKEYSFSLLCAYPVNGFGDNSHLEPFLKMCKEHSGVFPNESFLTISNEEDERLRNIAVLQQKTAMLERELALRESEARFRLLVEAVQDYAIFLLDAKGNVSSWNIGAERIKGYKAEEIIGKHFSTFYPAEDIANGKPPWELVVAEKEGRFEDEGWRLRKDGSRFWANVIITALKDKTGKLVGFAKVTRDFTERLKVQNELKREVAERKEAQEQLHLSEQSLRQLSLHLLRTQDEERKRIGRDLHDSLGQYLAVLKMKLDSVAGSMGENGGDASRDIAECIRLAEDSIKEVRTVSYLLYPPMLEEMGLKSAIPWYLDGFSSRSGIATTFEVRTDFGRIARNAELALFRILQESLTNVHRHSGSLVAHVRLSSSKGNCILEIEDKGRGINPALLEQASSDWMGAVGVGVRGMNERMRQLGGKLEIISKETGTRVVATIPAR